MWDLALSEHGDLMISGHGDLLGKSGVDLIEQRMLIRLRVLRGGWIYDTAKNFGSNLRRLIGTPPADAEVTATALVREALRDIDEITVEDVTATPQADRGILLVIYYRLRDTANGFVETGEERQLSISLSLAAASSGAGE